MSSIESNELSALRGSLSHQKKVEKYQEAFTMNQEFFHGKVVLNVGCGTGLLSMLAASVRYESLKSSTIYACTFDMGREDLFIFCNQ